MLLYRPLSVDFENTDPILDGQAHGNYQGRGDLINLDRGIVPRKGETLAVKAAKAFCSESSA